MRGMELIITGSGGVRLEGEAAKTHPVETMIATLLARLGLVSGQKPAAPPVTVYVAEELLFAKQFSLPVKGSGLKQAIGYQLDMLLPFPRGSYLYAHTAERGGQETEVTLYAVPVETIEPHLRELTEKGHAIAGLFPESRRYLGRATGKKEWALLLPGEPTTLLTFTNGRLLKRQLCSSLPTVEEAREQSGCERVFCPAPSQGSGFEDANSLFGDAPLGTDFDLLPPSYRRPDYFRSLLLGLALCNCLALLLLAGVKEYRFQRTSSVVDEQIARLQPEMKKANTLGSQESKIAKEINRLRDIGNNPDLLALLTTLTKRLPASAYLDQLRLEKKEATTLFLDGYADDMGELTASLQGLGEVRLKSTSRRNNKNYFQLEISLP